MKIAMSQIRELSELLSVLKKEEISEKLVELFKTNGITVTETPKSEIASQAADENISKDMFI